MNAKDIVNSIIRKINWAISGTNNLVIATAVVVAFGLLLLVLTYLPWILGIAFVAAAAAYVFYRGGNR